MSRPTTSVKKLCLNLQIATEEAKLISRINKMELFTWDSKALDHHCPLCKKLLSSVKARPCIGVHVEPCSNFHQTLHRMGTSERCRICNNEWKVHLKRHREILSIINETWSVKSAITTVKAKEKYDDGEWNAMNVFAVQLTLDKLHNLLHPAQDNPLQIVVISDADFRSLILSLGGHMSTACHNFSDCMSRLQIAVRDDLNAESYRIEMSIMRRSAFKAFVDGRNRREMDLESDDDEASTIEAPEGIRPFTHRIVELPDISPADIPGSTAAKTKKMKKNKRVGDTDMVISPPEHPARRDSVISQADIAAVSTTRLVPAPEHALPKEMNRSTTAADQCAAPKVVLVRPSSQTAFDLPKTAPSTPAERSQAPSKSYAATAASKTTTPTISSTAALLEPPFAYVVHQRKNKTKKDNKRKVADSLKAPQESKTDAAPKKAKLDDTTMDAIKVENAANVLPPASNTKDKKAKTTKAPGPADKTKAAEEHPVIPATKPATKSAVSIIESTPTSHSHLPKAEFGAEYISLAINVTKNELSPPCTKPFRTLRYGAPKTCPLPVWGEDLLSSLGRSDMEEQLSKYKPGDLQIFNDYPALDLMIDPCDWQDIIITLSSDSESMIHVPHLYAFMALYGKSQATMFYAFTTMYLCGDLRAMQMMFHSQVAYECWVKGKTAEKAHAMMFPERLVVQKTLTDCIVSDMLPYLVYLKRNWGTNVTRVLVRTDVALFIIGRCIALTSGFIHEQCQGARCERCEFCARVWKRMEVEYCPARSKSSARKGIADHYSDLSRQAREFQVATGYAFRCDTWVGRQDALDLATDMCFFGDL